MKATIRFLNGTQRTGVKVRVRDDELERQVGAEWKGTDPDNVDVVLSEDAELLEVLDDMGFRTKEVSSID